MLDETIASAQHNNSESLLALIEKFKPLLKKYAYKLHYEDAYYDLQLDFIQIILTINLDAQKQKSEGALVNYICNSVQHAYCKRLKTILGRAMPTVELDSPTNVQISNLLTASSHQEFSDFALDVANILTEKEYQVIVLVYKYQLSSAEIARRLCATRQNVNQCKKRAEQMLQTQENQTRMCVVPNQQKNSGNMRPLHLQIHDWRRSPARQKQHPAFR